jgi:proteasome assembly chaperone 3
MGSVPICTLAGIMSTNTMQIQVPLSAPSPAAIDMALPNASLLPLSHLTPKTLLGGGGDERESLGQLYAVQIASHIARRDSDEKRTLLLGLGLANPKPNRESFFDVIELVQKVL